MIIENTRMNKHNKGAQMLWQWMQNIFSCTLNLQVEALIAAPCKIYSQLSIYHTKIKTKNPHVNKLTIQILYIQYSNIWTSPSHEAIILHLNHNHDALTSLLSQRNSTAVWYSSVQPELSLSLSHTKKSG